MSRKHSQASANPKTSSSQQPTLTYAQLAGNNSGRSSNASTPAPATPASAPAPSSAASQPTATPASQPNPPKSFSAAAKQDSRQRTPTNGAGNQSNSNSGNASGVSGHGGAGAARGGNANNNNNNATSGGAGARNREAAVRLPSRNSVSSAATPNIQFGSLNKQARPQTPPTAQKQNQGAASATSGGAMPANMAKPAAKPSFGSIKSHGDDSHSGNAGNKRPANANNNSGNAADSHSRQHHGRQQQQQHGQQQQQRSGSRASNQGRQSQNHSGFKHGGPKGGPKPQEAAASSDSSAPFHPQHHEGGAPNHSGHHNQSQNHQQNPPMTMAMPGAPASAPHSSSSSMSGQQQQPQHQGGSHYGGAPYRGQGHQHVRPPHTQGHTNAPYKPQGGAHYPPHHMGAPQQMSQPMAFPMPGPGQPPMQQAIMTTQPGMPPMQGWMPPPPQFAYMQVGGPGYDQYYRAPHGSAGPPPHSMYGMPNYSMPAPQHAGPTPMGPGGMIGGPMSGAPMPGMTAAPMGSQQQPPHHSGNLSASAQAFVPGNRRPVRIVNPNTNEEVDLSSQRLRSVSAASSTPRNAASGTASPAPGVSEKRDASGTPADLSSTEEPAKPKFKFPVNRAIKIVDPNLVAKSDKKDETKAEAEPAAVAADDKPAPSTKEEVQEIKPEADAVADLTEALAKTSIEAEAKAEEAQAAAAAVETTSTEPSKPAASPETVPEPEAAAEPETVTETKAEVEIEVEAEAPAAPKEEVAEAEPVEAETKTDVKAEAEVETKVEAEAEVEAEVDEEKEEEDVEQNEEQEEEEEEEGEIDEEEESAPQTPTPLTGRSRQVTFSEPVTPSIRTMSSTEIADLYSGEKDAPTLVGEILKYPRVFLERFNGLCKPPAGFNLEIVNTDERRSSDRGSGMRRSMSGSGRSRDQQMSSSNVMSGFGGMGNFRHVNSSAPHTHAPLGTSEERFRQSTHEMKSRMDSAPRSGSSMGGRPPSGQYRNNLGSNRESRGGRTGGRGRGRGRGRGGSQHGGDRYGGGPGGQNDLPTDFKPLVKSENRYVAKSLRVGKNAVEDDMQEEVYHRRMQALLNKLTPDNFPDVSTELLEWGNKSIKETDGRILRHLVMLVFEKATDEPVWASIYAKLCFRLIVDINKDISDENVLNKDGNLMTGMQLVRKYLLTKCQDDFERGWKVEMPADMESAEYYEAVKIKRRGLGLIQFIGELFLLDILSERIIHNCIRRLLANYESPEGEETESMAKLLTTVGKKMDHPEAESFMKVYFQRIQAMSVNKKLDSRIRFKLKDVIDLRQNKWVSRTDNAGPKTIAEIHEEIEKAKVQEEKMRRAASSAGRRSESHAGRGEGSGGRRSGWNTVGGPSGSGRSEQSQRTGDMTGFGDMTRSKAQRVGGNPFSVLSGGSRGWRGANSSDGRKNRDDRPRSLMLGPGGRTPSHSSRAGNNSGGDATPVTPEPVGTSNMFDALMNEEEDSAHHASPRAEPARSGSKVPPLSASSMSSAKDKKEAKPMDSETLARKTKGMIAEYVQLKMDSEFVECFKELGEINYQAAVYDLVNNIMERRVEHVEQVVKGVALLEADAGLSVDTAIAGLSEFSEQLVDISLDAPNAFRFFGMMMAATHVPLSRVVETLGDLATNVSSPLPAGFPIVAAYLKQLIVMNGEDKTRQDIEDAKFDIVQLLNKDRRSDAEVRRSLNMQDLLPLFPKFA
ncbi:hypothetical protein LPJ53_001926 [Coemansia erecta]|uniref:MIF4G domain-containing protein n=1 Tax=Coemansia erecta TaxID=147472 RepID=A0A9W7Y4D0_9FUNG|nr:hypothetical protein LPJ53_001926 [Coemansia erecta]